MTAIIFESTAILSDAGGTPGVGDPPGTTKAITNSFDGEGQEKLSLVFHPVGGTTPTAEVTTYIWDGTKYQPTGDQFILDPVVNNFFEFNGGVYLAVAATITGSPTSWEIFLGRRPS